MQIETSRFDSVEIEPDDILIFPDGLIAFNDCKHWVLLADAENDAIGWLQSISRPDVALAVVSPRRFVPGYQVRINRGQVQPLQIEGPHQAYVLVVVNKQEERLTLNLRAPLIINLDRRLGRQVVTNDDQDMQHPVKLSPAASLRKIA